MASTIHIRRIEDHEHETARALVQTVADEIFEELFAPYPVPVGEEDWSLAWIAISDTEIVGVVLTNEEWISNLWVTRENRRKGVGQRLLRRGESEIASLGYPISRLRVVKSNAGAVQFYLRQGWKVEREFPHEKFHHAMLEMSKSNQAMRNV